ncbi:MAG: ATP-dependent Clp protease ATP-binding subunit [Bacteroidales bacterium]|jgi:ATP-dependent Clp protease ATP-binding subunit ClpC|nr:ATP-dependent Clp protease ATP-binding subunit [Bacteroidales bacterium]
MDSEFSSKLRDVLTYSREEAIRLGNDQIEPEHILLGILREGEGVAIDLLSGLGIDLGELKQAIERVLYSNKDVDMHASLQILKSTDRILKIVSLEVRALRSPSANTGHLLLALLRDKDSRLARILNDFAVNYSLVKSKMEATDSIDSDDTTQAAQTSMPQNSQFDDDDDEYAPFRTPNSPKKQQQAAKSDTPVLDNFGIDITKAAEQNSLDPVVGREREIERIAQILSRRKKNNPILIGEPGVGKSAIAEGLALRIVQKKVSRVLFDKRVISLDIASIVAGTKYRGQFEERMKSILNELMRVKNVILFIDEIHTIVGAGGASGSLDAANMLKPALARGDIQCIGATTLDEYRQQIEKDGALERRFQKVLVEPTSIDETISILHNIKDRYEAHHNVSYTDDAIEACVKLTARYITDRFLPDKAIDALDEAGSRVHISNIIVPDKIVGIEEKLDAIRNEKVKAVKNQSFELAADFRDKEKNLLMLLDMEKSNWEQELARHREVVNAEKVAEVVAMMSGVPVQRIAQAEGERLLNMTEALKGSVIGQDAAIVKVVKSIQRNRAGLKDPNRPIGSFIFLGPTGVGKTQLAKVLATYLFDSVDALVRIDMSEYMEKFSVSRIVGAPPGYVGYEEGGQLTEKVRRKPYCVVLLDEIEKAHPDVFHILLQMLDEGRLTDSLGRQVDFRNTIIIMTSNIGSRQLTDFGAGIGFNTQNRTAAQESEHSKHVVEKALKRTFAPEFLNRVDDVVTFNTLSKDDIHKIIDIELRGLYERMAALHYSLVIDEEAKNFIADKGYDSQYGARPLKRAIQKYIEDEMAEVILHANFCDGATVNVTLDSQKENVVINVDAPISAAQ